MASTEAKSGGRIAVGHGLRAAKSSPDAKSGAKSGANHDWLSELRPGTSGCPRCGAISRGGSTGACSARAQSPAPPRWPSCVAGSVPRCLCGRRLHAVRHDRAPPGPAPRPREAGARPRRSAAAGPRRSTSGGGPDGAPRHGRAGACENPVRARAAAGSGRSGRCRARRGARSRATPAHRHDGAHRCGERCGTRREIARRCRLRGRAEESARFGRGTEPEGDRRPRSAHHRAGAGDENRGGAHHHDRRRRQGRAARLHGGGIARRGRARRALCAPSSSTVRPLLARHRGVLGAAREPSPRRVCRASMRCRTS